MAASRFSKTVHVAGDMHGLAAALEAADDRKIASRHTPFLCQEPQQRLVGAPLRRRRGNGDLQYRGAVGEASQPVHPLGPGARREAHRHANPALRRGEGQLT